MPLIHKALFGLAMSAASCGGVTSSEPDCVATSQSFACDSLSIEFRAIDGRWEDPDAEPHEGMRFYTVQLGVTLTGTLPEAADPFGAGGYQLELPDGSLWSASTVRKPSLSHSNPGGWLTFEIPLETSKAIALLWSPGNGTTYRLEFPDPPEPSARPYTYYAT